MGTGKFLGKPNKLRRNGLGRSTVDYAIVSRFLRKQHECALFLVPKILCRNLEKLRL